MVPPNHWPLPPPMSPTELCAGTSNRKSAPMLRITDRSFQYDSPRHWNQLRLLCQPRTNLSNSEFLTHLVLSVTFYRFHRPLSSHSHLIPDLKPSVPANPSHRSLLFLLRDWIHGFQSVYRYVWAHPFSLLPTFSFGSVRQIKPTYVSFWAHVKIPHRIRIVSYVETSAHLK